MVTHHVLLIHPPNEFKSLPTSLHPHAIIQSFQNYCIYPLDLHTEACVVLEKTLNLITHPTPLPKTL